MKRCSKCGEEKENAEFYRVRKDDPHKLQSSCKACNKLRRQTPEYRAWAAAHWASLDVKQKRKRYAADKYRKAARDKYNTSCHGWAAKAVYSARHRCDEVTITADYLVSLRDKIDRDYEGCCPVFYPAGIRLPLQYGGGKLCDGSAQIDRLDPTQGYTPDNVRIISRLANTMKQNVGYAHVKALADWLAKETNIAVSP